MGDYSNGFISKNELQERVRFAFLQLISYVKWNVRQFYISNIVLA